MIRSIDNAFITKIQLGPLRENGLKSPEPVLLDTGRQPILEQQDY
jgi:hypothetical protein